MPCHCRAEPAPGTGAGRAVWRAQRDAGPAPPRHHQAADCVPGSLGRPPPPLRPNLPGQQGRALAGMWPEQHIAGISCALKGFPPCLISCTAYGCRAGVEHGLPGGGTAAAGGGGVHLSSLHGRPGGPGAPQACAREVRTRAGMQAGRQAGRGGCVLDATNKFGLNALPIRSGTAALPSACALAGWSCGSWMWG